jgi:hypothetical protein
VRGDRQLVCQGLTDTALLAWMRAESARNGQTLSVSGGLTMV